MCWRVGGHADARVTKIYRKIAFCLKASSCHITWAFVGFVAAVAEKWLEVSLAENRVDGGGDRVLRLSWVMYE